METKGVNPQARLMSDLKNFQKATDTVAGVGGSGEKDFMNHLSDFLADHEQELQEEAKLSQAQADQNRGKEYNQIPIDQRL